MLLMMGVDVVVRPARHKSRGKGKGGGGRVGAIGGTKRVAGEGMARGRHLQGDCGDPILQLVLPRVHFAPRE